MENFLARIYPHFSDSLKGIWEYYLPLENIYAQEHEVKEALDSLIEKGIMKRVEYESVVLYKVNRGHDV